MAEKELTPQQKEAFEKWIQRHSYGYCPKHGMNATLNVLHVHTIPHPDNEEVKIDFIHSRCTVCHADVWTTTDVIWDH